MLVVLGLVALGAGLVIYQSLAQGLPSVSDLDHYRPAETTRILSTDGAVIGTLFQENRIWKPLGEISPHVVKALLAIEDSRFYDHAGVDPIGVVRAAYNAATTGEVREGASTITMQLARNLFLTNDPNLGRKLREVILALRIERAYDKEKILELYLNQVYFGSGAYGIHAAAQTFFNKGADQLTPAEAALIAGLLQAPSKYSPLVDPEAGRARQQQVLERMRELGYLDQEQLRQAVQEADGMVFGERSEHDLEVFKYPHFTGYVVKELSQRYPEEVLYRSGLTITTTLDPRIQAEAERIVQARVAELADILNVEHAALVLIENETGYIRAMVGGATGWSREDQFNRAWQARRQPGSSFKAIVYAAALEEGYTPESLVDDTRTSYDDGTGKAWSPKNSDGRYLGRITLRQALRGSRNVAAVKLLSQVGVEPVIRLAYSMGIRSRIPQNLSIALGAVEATPLEMAEVFSSIVNQGIDRRPTAVKTVTAEDGTVLEDNRHREGTRVLSQQAALGMISMLTDVVTGGTGTNAQVPGHLIAGKTGTTDEFRDAWFVGFSPQYTLAVWVGNDDNSAMWTSYGGDLPATIFREVMGVALEGVKPASFPAYVPPKKKGKDAVTAAEATPEPEETPTPEPEETPEELLEEEEPLPELTPLEVMEPPLPEEVDIEAMPPAEPVEEPAPDATPAGWFDVPED